MTFVLLMKTNHLHLNSQMGHILNMNPKQTQLLVSAECCHHNHIDKCYLHDYDRCRNRQDARSNYRMIYLPNIWLNKNQHFKFNQQQN